MRRKYDYVMLAVKRSLRDRVSKHCQKKGEPIVEWVSRVIRAALSNKEIK
jgi:hypothetical protein